MAEIRTLKLNLLADVNDFGKGINQAETATTGFGNTVSKVSKIASAAFFAMGAAAGYAAIRIGKDSVAAALEDEASQAALAKTLQNVTNATIDTIAQTEKWITKQQLSSGFSDSKLRPALSNLVRVTDDLTEAQKLTTLAMDISRGTGKDLETVSLALAKAHEGNLGALTKLGVPLDENIKKTGDFTAATQQLTDLFGGQAATYADTYQGKLDIVNQRLGELKESAGASLLGVLGNLLTHINDVAKGFAGETGSLASAMSTVTKEGYYSPSGGENLGMALQNVADAMNNLFAALTENGDEGISYLELLTGGLNLLAGAINAVTSAWNSASGWTDKYLGGGLRLQSPLGAITGGRAAGGSVSAGQAYRVGEFGPEMFVPNASGKIMPNAGGGTTIINLNGIIDAESARRSIEKLLQNSARRTGAINLVGATL